MSAYYNEHDPFAAAWLRELIKDNLIAPGEVDERDILDVPPDDLRPFRQVHLFAGIGIWSAALRAAGWDDERRVLTVSCPCQPFSQAGAGGGFADERHLWPAAFHLIGELGPPVVLGEQVASPDGETWLDLVSADMEAAAYTGAPFDLCSAGFGAPNIRQRLYFVWLANAYGRQRNGLSDGQGCQPDRKAPRRQQGHGQPECGGKASGVADTSQLGHERSGAARRWGDGSSYSGDAGGLANADDAGPQGRVGVRERAAERPFGAGGMAGGMADTASRGNGRQRGGGAVSKRLDSRKAGGLADTDCAGQTAQPGDDGKVRGLQEAQRQPGHGSALSRGSGSDGRPGPTNGFWRDADWLLCRDPDGPRWRPVRPGSFPLATGYRNRVGLLRGAGNAINKEVAQGFIESVMAVIADRAASRSEAA